MKAQKRSTNEQFMPGIFNKTGYEFIYNPEDKNIYALSNGQKILFEDIDDKLFLIDLDEEILTNKNFLKGIEGKNLTIEEKRWQFAFCFLCGYDGSLDYEDSVFQYDHNKYCEKRENCPYSNMCEKAVEYGGIKLSRREHQIIVMISMEEKNSSIAATMQNSILTTNTQLYKLYSKIGVSSRAGLMKFAHMHNLI